MANMSRIIAVMLIALTISLAVGFTDATIYATPIVTPTHSAQWGGVIIQDVADNNNSMLSGKRSFKVQYTSGLTLATDQVARSVAGELFETTTQQYYAANARKASANTLEFNDIVYPANNRTKTAILVAPIAKMDPTSPAVLANVTLTQYGTDNTTTIDVPFSQNMISPSWAANFTVDLIAHNKTVEWVKLGLDVINNIDIESFVLTTIGLKDAANFTIATVNDTTSVTCATNLNFSAFVSLADERLFISFPQNTVIPQGHFEIDCAKLAGLNSSKAGSPVLVVMGIESGPNGAALLTVLHNEQTALEKFGLVGLVAIAVGILIALLLVIVLVRKCFCRPKEQSDDIYQPLNQ